MFRVSGFKAQGFGAQGFVLRGLRFRAEGVEIRALLRTKSPL